jgi:protein involved in polysaccharide export with SLBB domain
MSKFNSKLLVSAFVMLCGLGFPADAVFAQQLGQMPQEGQPQGNGQQSTQTGRAPLMQATTIDDSNSPIVIVQDTRQPYPLDPPESDLQEYEQGEFEAYVQQVTGQQLPRFGTNLLLPEDRDFSLAMNAAVPPDYRVQIGDVIAISLAGPVDGSVEREVDRNGQIFLPSVGNVKVAGVRQGDLRDYIAGAIGTQYRNFRVGVRVEELNGIRVFVTGFATNPGSFTLSNLSTVSNAILKAGGPTAGGSFRSVKLIRDGREVGEFDLYELLLSGSRANDPVLEPDDVLFIPPVGEQVAVVGSVNQGAIYDLKGGESFADILTLAGGRTTLGERDRVIVYRAAFGDLVGPLELAGPLLATTPILAGDIVQVLPQGSLKQPRSRQSIVVTIEGEVAQPGNYVLPASASFAEVLALAGGLTDRAFPYGTVLERLSIREQQRKSFDEALDQFELALASAPLDVDTSIDVTSQQARLNNARATLDELRKTEPDGRLVLALQPSSPTPPLGLLLENGDRIKIPATPSSVGVYGAVYRPASFELAAGDEIEDYLDRSGGVIRGGDRRRLFVVRANGEVLPRNRGALSADAVPGDVVFVPVKTKTSSLLSRISQFSSIVFQLGLSAATVAAIN